MKYLFVCALLMQIDFASYSQLSYSDLSDLNALCKKEDFEAAKTFLLNEGYNIKTFNVDYDHGSYYVLGEIDAEKTDNENFLASIKVEFDDNDDLKVLTVSQYLGSTWDLLVNSKKLEPIYSWQYKDWTQVSISDYDLFTDVFPKKYDSIQHYITSLDTSQPNYKLIVGYNLMQTGNIELGKNSTLGDYSIKKVDNELIRNCFLKHEFKRNEYFNMDFINVNPNYGDLTNYSVMYRFDSGKTNYYQLNVDLVTRFFKGQNTVTSNSNFLSFPLIKRGKTYILQVRFGKLVKLYVLDSGASDMSIDDQTYQYLKNTNQLKNEDRLSDAEYQMADGSIVKFKRVRIPSFSINSITVKDIDATIVQTGKPLLLGKSFLDSFKSWKIDNEDGKLIVELF